MKKPVISVAIASVLCSGWVAAENYSVSAEMHVAEKMVG